MKAALILALIGALLALCSWPLIRSDALVPGAGRALIGYTLGYVGAALIFIAAFRVALS